MRRAGGYQTRHWDLRCYRNQFKAQDLRALREVA